uniref:Uncharacterized protein n=1 Tax=Neogoniolithon spectabile TaxID=231755 RepID=A0A3G3MH73_9FLOR|nr:hypothetical protein [Neogoniolithon spectabile]AYR06152.1 hypothetical protein [Neogoniolithon spectabile]
MITYWPNHRSVDLNLAVARLFVEGYTTLSSIKINQTNKLMPLDLLNLNVQQYLFKEILIEFEILILDITEINIQLNHLEILIRQLIYDLLKRIQYKFLVKLVNTTYLHTKYINSRYTNFTLSNETQKIIYLLLIYCLFGSSKIKQGIFLFFNSKTPTYHVQLLFEHMIIDISNIITLDTIKHQRSIYKLHQFLTSNHLCNKRYSSLRSLANFHNNLISNNYLYQYIHYPLQIYRSTKIIYFLQTGKIFHKVIYMNRTSKYTVMSKLQFITILCLELQDFILPKLNYIIVLLGKFIIFVVNEILNKSVYLCSKIIVNNINREKK